MTGRQRRGTNDLVDHGLLLRLELAVLHGVARVGIWVGAEEDGLKLKGGGEIMYCRGTYLRDSRDVDVSVEWNTLTGLGDW